MRLPLLVLSIAIAGCGAPRSTTCEQFASKVVELQLIPGSMGSAGALVGSRSKRDPKTQILEACTQQRLLERHGPAATCVMGVEDRRAAAQTCDGLKFLLEAIVEHIR